VLALALASGAALVLRHDAGGQRSPTPAVHAPRTPQPSPASTAPTSEVPTSGVAAPTLARPTGPDVAGERYRDAVAALLLDRARVARAGDARKALARAVQRVVPVARPEQARLLRSLAAVPFTSYRVTADGVPPPAAVQRGHVTERLTVHYRLAGDAAASQSTVRASLVRRDGRWLLAGWRPTRPQLWDLGAVRVAVRGPVLVLGDTSPARLDEVAAAAREALAGVRSVWPYRWSRRATVLVPQDARDMAALLHLDRTDLTGLGALTTGERPGRASTTVRVTVNPSYFWGLSPQARQILLRHELAHVAQYGLGARRLRGVPTWLTEGVAEYIGYRGQGVPFDVVAADLLDEVGKGRLPALPDDAAFDFGGSDQQRTLAYRAGWTFCVYLADRFGAKAPLRLYHAVARTEGHEHARVATALRATTGTALPRVVRDWHAWLSGQA
jgi:hypothetical protein